MLSPRLTNCPECANIPSLLKKIDCKLAELGNNLYNNISYMLNKPVPSSDILQLIGYRRILMYKYCNPSYVEKYSVQMIASRVIRLTAGCVSKCNEPERCLEEPCDIKIVPNPTTTSTSTLPIPTTTTSTTAVPTTTTTSSSSTSTTTSTSSSTTTSTSSSTTTTTTSLAPTTTTTTSFNLFSFGLTPAVVCAGFGEGGFGSTVSFVGATGLCDCTGIVLTLGVDFSTFGYGVNDIVYMGTVGGQSRQFTVTGLLTADATGECETCVTTTTTTTVILSACTVFINTSSAYPDGSANILSYDPITNQSDILAILPGSVDMANTINKLWIYNIATYKILEYNITLSPWSINFNRYIDYPSGIYLGVGLGAITDTLLISTDIPSGTIIELDITGSTAIVTNTLATLDSGYSITGDILLTTTGKIICTANNSGGIIKLLQYDALTGIKEVDVDITSYFISEYPLGVFEYDNKLYLAGNNLYEVDLISPYILTMVNSLSFQTSGASSAPSCGTVNLIVGSTTTTTSSSSTSTTTSTSSSTSTTTTTTTIPCINYGWDLTDVPPSTEVTLNYTDCYGNLMSTTLAAADFGQPFFYFCARIDTPSTPDTTGGFVNNGSCPCNPNFTKTNYSGVQYRNGDTIPEVTDPTVWASLTTGAWCHVNNNPANDALYGKLYNWYAITDPRGFAPIGYHVPSNDEWICLINVWGGEIAAGGKLKEAGTSNWIAPNTGATNVSDFTALPGGYRFSNGTYLGFGEIGYFWSSVELPFPKAYELSYVNSAIYGATKNPTEGSSVRLIIE
jgi:uncharacterized protein (TIGR02145 family)